jgi:hypothetical protein
MCSEMNKAYNLLIIKDLKTNYKRKILIYQYMLQRFSEQK